MSISSIHRYDLVCILPILGDRLIIRVIINEIGLVIDLLFDRSHRDLRHDSPGRRNNHLVTLSRVDVKGPAVIIEIIIIILLLFWFF